MMWCSNEVMQLNEGMTGRFTYTTPASAFVQCVCKRHNVTSPLSLYGTPPSTTRMLQTRKSPRQRQSPPIIANHGHPLSSSGNHGHHFLIESVFLEFYEKTRLKIYRQSMFWRIEYMAVLDVHDQRA